MGEEVVVWKRKRKVMGIGWVAGWRGDVVA